jgi:O-antigen/teichoic acid export membrane protein
MIKNISKRLNSDGAYALQMMLLLRQVSIVSIAVLMPKFFFIQEIGIVESLQYLLATFSIFWINGLLQWFLPAYQHTPQAERNAFLWRVFLSFCALSALVFLFLLLEKSFVFSFFLQKKPFDESLIFFVYGLFFLPSYCLEYFLFVKNENRNILIISILTFIFQNGAILIAWYFNWGIAGIFKVWLLLAVLRFLICLVLALPSEKSFLTPELPSWQRLIHYIKRIPNSINHPALPLIGYAFMAQWALTFDGWLVNYQFMGDAMYFAIFRYGAREIPIVLSLATGLSAAMSMEIAKDFSEGIKKLKEKTLKLYHLLFPLTAVLLLSSSVWFPLVFSKAFTESVLIFDIFLLTILSRMLFPQTVAIALQENKSLFYISIIELLINILASVILVQYFGLAGIAAGTCLAALSEKLLIAAYLYRKHHIQWNTYTPLNMWALYSVGLIICFVCKVLF